MSSSSSSSSSSSNSTMWSDIALHDIFRKLLSKLRFRSNSKSEWVPLAKQALTEADKTISLDHSDAANHIFRALVLDHSDAANHIFRALVLDPSDAANHFRQNQGQGDRELVFAEVHERPLKLTTQWWPRPEKRPERLPEKSMESLLWQRRLREKLNLRPNKLLLREQRLRLVLMPFKLRLAKKAESGKERIVFDKHFKIPIFKS